MNNSRMMRYQFCRPHELARLRAWKIDEAAVAVRFATTPDGWRLGISHYRDLARNPPTRRYPVLLCHGLGANRLVFDIDPRFSLPAWLVAQGYDVYAVDLRGHGLSEKPGVVSGKSWGWGINEYCALDLPTAIAAVLAMAGTEALHFVGHSMGGILLYCHAASADHRIISGTTIGASLDYRGTPSDFHHLSPLATLTHLLPNVPMHWPALFASKAAGFSKNMIASSLVNPDNVDIDVYRKLAANLLHPVSPRVLRDLNGLMNGLGMKAANGNDYAQLLHTKGYPFPILSLAGEADTQCPPASAARFGTQHQSFGRKHGHAIDYGHHDLIMGTHAEQEVWPCLGHWLAQHDRPIQAGIRRLG